MICKSYMRFFEVFANDTRLKIIDALRDSAKCVSDICKHTGQEQSKISHNLAVLTRCNVVEQTKAGRQRIYSLNKKTIIPLMKVIDKHVFTYCKGGCKRK